MSDFIPARFSGGPWDGRIARIGLVASVRVPTLYGADLSGADLSGAYGRDDWDDLVARGAIR